MAEAIPWVVLLYIFDRPLSSLARLSWADAVEFETLVEYLVKRGGEK